MKLIKTKVPQLLAAQTGRTGIAAAKMTNFNLVDENIARVDVAYYELVENTNGIVGDPLHNTVPLNVTGSMPNQPNTKRITLSNAQAQGMWQAINGAIPKGANLLKSLSDQFTIATLGQMVTEKNFVKISKGELVPLDYQDWEIVDQQELITQEIYDAWNPQQEDKK